LTQLPIKIKALGTILEVPLQMLSRRFSIPRMIIWRNAPTASTC
jgi:hypothetical protein